MFEKDKTNNVIPYTMAQLVERLPCMRKTGVRSPVATDL